MSRDLPVRGSGRCERRNLAFLGSEGVGRRNTPLSGILTGLRKFDSSPLGECVGTDRVELLYASWSWSRLSEGRFSWHSHSP